MSTRTKRRRFKREEDEREVCSHHIRIGKKAGNRPGQLNGFLIHFDRLDQNNRPIIDYEAMANLGVDKETVDKAVAAGRKGVGLPTQLHVRIQRDAIREDGGWSHPSTFAEHYIAFGQQGLICKGDGLVAERVMPDLTKKKVPCCPAGCAGVDPSDYCPISVSGECKSNYTLYLSLFTPSGEDGAPKPLNKAHDWSARYKFSSTSETCGMAIGRELDSVADQVDGHTQSLTGILVFTKSRKRYNDNGKSVVSIVPGVQLIISPVDVQQRRAEIRQAFLDDRIPQQAKLEPAEPQKALAAPEGAAAPPRAESPPVEAEAIEEPIQEPVPVEPEPAQEMAPVEPGDLVVNGFLYRAVPIAEATDQELTRALENCAMARKAQFGAVALFQDKKTLKVVNVPAPEWFYGDTEEYGMEFRQEILRKICYYQAGKNDGTFTVFSSTGEPVSPPDPDAILDRDNEEVPS